MSDSQRKFQQLLRELFQFDSADLDFGIYRIMNRRRDVIEHFVTVELPQAITDELNSGAQGEQGRLKNKLVETARQVRDALGDAALDADGNLAEAYHATRIGGDYLKLRASAAGARDHDAQEAAVYNHLFAFFRRYYQDGDFISKRRYSKQERYAIPYNGEEVMLYWANHDQYYVKSGEYFTDYSYQASNGVTVHFKLQGADVEQNNVKGDKRFFLPQADGIDWDEKAGVLVIPCVYRPLTQQETVAYGKSNQQEAIIAQAVAAIPARLSKEARALAALTATRRIDAKGNPVTYLEHHLRQYTRRNTSDFFIHKNLADFLGRELDFYLKNEVLNLAEMAAAGEELAAGWFQLLRLIKRVGGRIIDFLAQIEAFQKMLWEKRKFVTATFYCIRVGVIAKEFHAEIAANDAQWQAWQTHFALDDPKTPAKRKKLLQAHPSLMLDTRHFAPDSPDFVDRLLASFDDLDGWTLLRYMLRWETRHSETLLNVAKLDSPFAYTLRLHRDGATREQPVDLPETFAYLLGLTVRTRTTYDDGGRRYLLYRGALRDGRTVAVLWRDTAGWTEADYARDRDFVAAQKLAADADDIFVNGDSFIPGAQALEGVFKARMFAPVEAQR